MVGSFGTPAKKESAELESNPSSKTPGAGSTVIVVIPLGLPGMGKSSLLERLFQMGQQAAVKTYRQGKLEKPGDGAGQPLKTLHSVATLSSDEFTGDELKMLRISTSQFGGVLCNRPKYGAACFLLGLVFLDPRQGCYNKILSRRGALPPTGRRPVSESN